MEGLTMFDVKKSLQIHSVREAFEENPAEALKRVKAMGYEGVELNYPAMKKAGRPAALYAEALKDAGLKCFSFMISLEHVETDGLDYIIEYAKTLGTETMVIGAVNFRQLKEEPGYAQKALELIKMAAEAFEKAGFVTGYHNHDSDQYVVDGEKTFLEYLMSNTPNSFVMMLDTGNMLAGGGDPIAMVKKFPGRSPIVHIKGYGQAEGYTTPVWDSEIDWKEMIKTAVELGGTKIMSIEFGKRGDYEPFDRAEKSFVWLSEQLQ